MISWLELENFQIGAQSRYLRDVKTRGIAAAAPQEWYPLLIMYP